MLLFQTLGGLLLVLGSFLVIRAVWIADQPLRPAQRTPRGARQARRYGRAA